MIFKTINSSVDETRKSLALFNKDWDTYKRNWQNANGVFGKIGSIFTPANAITKSDIDAIKAYNAQIDSCVTSQTAYNRTMLNASSAAQNLVASYNGRKVSEQDMATAQNAAKASTVGLTIAQTALNAAIDIGIGLLISLIVKGIDKLVHANEEAIEKAEELQKKYEKFKSTNENNISTLNGLKKEFEELSKGVSQYGDNISLTTEQYERYKKIIQQIVGMSPSLAEGYSTENGYIADKNGLLERAIELQKQEYRNELRKRTNLDNLKTSMSRYIAEYKEAFNGGLVTDDMSAISTTTATDLSNALYQVFNLNGSGKHNYDNTEKIARKIIESLGIEDVNSEIQKYINKNGIFESSWFFKAYADTIAENIEVITGSLTADAVGLDDIIFDQNVEKVDSATQSYLDMKDAISIANESIQRDLVYIAEYADGYSNLSTEQQKFVNEFLKGYSISNIMSESNNPFDQGWKFDKDKMASIKSQITKFVEALSQDETTKKALTDLYAIPTDEQSIGEFVEQFRNALEIIKAYCKENGIEIPIAISDSEQSINNLEAQYQRAVDFAKEKFDGYDPTAFLKKHSINTQEEIDAWQKIAQKAKEAAEAEKEYVQSSTLNNKNPISLSISDTIDQLNTRLKPTFDSLKSALQDIFSDDGKFNLNSIDILSTCDSIKSKLDELNNIDGVAVDYSAFEDFVKVLRNSESTENDAKKAFDSLATSITQAALSGAEDFETMKAALENLGVVNSEMVAFGALINNANALEEAIGQAGLTMDQFVISTEDGNIIASKAAQAFVKEMVGTENCKHALALLQLQQLLCNENSLDTSEDINACYMLAQAADIASDTLGQLYNLKAQYDAADNPHTKAAIAAQMEALKSTLQAEFANIQTDFGAVGGKTGASNAGKEAGDAYVNAFEEELSTLADLRDRGAIDEAEYLQRLKELYTGYFADRKKYLDEFSKYERQYLEGMKSLYESALSGTTKLMDSKIDEYTESKEAAVKSLESEKQAAEDAYQTQIDALDDLIAKKQESIDSIQKEIDAMKEAREERQRQLNLQQAQYELEHAQNQRTILQYSRERGLHYVTDTKAVRDAKEKVDDAKFDIEVAEKEKEIKLLEDSIGLLEKQKEALEEAKEESAKYYDSLIARQEKYWDTMIKNMEQQKSKWQELAEIEEVAEAYSAIGQVFGELGYSVEDILNGSESAFEDFKSRYISILSDMNQNTSFQEGLEYASGVAKENFGSIVTDAQGAVQELSQIFSDGTFSQAITQGVSNGIVSAKQELDNMNQLGSDAGEGFISGWNEKSGEIPDATKQTAIDAVEAFAEGQDSHSPSVKYQELAGDAIDGLLLGVEENKQSFIDTVKSLAEDGVLAFEEGFNFEDSTLNTSFDALKVLIESVTEALGLGTDETVGGLLGALTQLSSFTFNDNSIIEQFNNLKTAVDSVASAIGGGGEPSGSERQGGLSGSVQGRKSGTKGPKGTGSSLTGAITEIGTTAKEVIGESEAEGDGTVIGMFGSLKTAVDEVTGAIGTGDPAGGKESGGGNADNLTASITSLGKQTNEVFGKPGGNGVIGRFEEFTEPVKEADEHIQSIAKGLDDINGKEVTCTITVNVNQNGSMPTGGTSETVSAPAVPGSTEYTASYSKTNTENTSRIRTGSTPANTVITPDGYVFRPLQASERAWELQQAFRPIIDQLKLDNNFENLSGSAMAEHNNQMEQMIRQLNTTNVVNNNKNVQPVVHNEIHVTLPNVTNSTSAESLLRDLESLSTKKFQVNW